MGRLLRRVVARAHAASLAAPARRFEAACIDVIGFQEAKLRQILKANADTAFGERHGFARIGSPAEYQRAVPVRDHAAHSPWIERVARGEERVLTRERVLMMERSGGSTSARTKLVPYTRALLDEFAAATAPWMHDLHARFPAIAEGRAYWAVSPVAEAPARTAGGLRIGFEDDTAYFGPLARWGLRQTLAVPPAVARIRDVDSWRRETARRLLEAEDLALLSVWSPTYLSLLMEEVAREAGDDAPGLGERLWPRLALVSCWTDGPSARFAADLRRWFPTVPIQGKGLLATEGVVTFPLCGAPAPVAAVASHFFEFLDLDAPDAPRPLLVHELRAGGRYSPLLTTSGGLYRYHLQDVVTCVGHHERAPLLRFDGRLDHASDLCGEKVTLGQAEEAIQAALEKSSVASRFAMLAPSLEGGPHYALYVETDSPRVAEAAEVIDAWLAQAHPYAYCRRIGQLGPVRVVRVRDAWRAWERALVRRGQRVGAAKPASLDARPEWDGVFDEVRAA